MAKIQKIRQTKSDSTCCVQRIEDKGREYGSYVRAGEFRWFVRETGTVPSVHVPVSLLIRRLKRTFNRACLVRYLSRDGRCLVNGQNKVFVSGANWVWI
jgi:hypothetical protein